MVNRGFWIAFIMILSIPLIESSHPWCKTIPRNLLKDMRKKYIKYQEGQWFAVPLRSVGYGIGIIVRGEYSTKGGLGYFFGPKYHEVPKGVDTLSKNRDNALLICRFGDYGIVNGKWLLIENGKPFVREEWPVPKFHRIPPLPPGQAVLVEYPHDSKDMFRPLCETAVPITSEILALPDDMLFASGSVEIALTNIIEE
jgi:hypothetical protein